MGTAVELGRSLVAGRYRVESVLGVGGMGAVYAVRDESNGRRLALKRKHDQARAEPFEREYRTLASLHHPGIVEAYDYGVDAEGAFYTMELLEGGDLRARAPMPWRDACSCLRDAASILGVLHARRLVHRDLGPRNLWRLPDGRLKLLDFGSLAPFGVASEIVGTPAFVPPEALHTKALDQRTDLYALGALGYWLLTSVHAYRAANLGALRAAWQHAPTAPSELAKHIDGADADIPAAVDALILSLLRLDPAERPHSADEVVDQLDALVGARAEVDASALDGYLDSSVFVGRRRERGLFEHALTAAASGRPHAFVLEGPEGAGRTRLLAELRTMGGVSGATVVCAGASVTGRPYDAARALGLALLAALPEAARAAAEPHLAGLARVLPELAPGAPPAAPAQTLAEERVRSQRALANWILALAAQHTLALLVDDLQAMDDESQALLATLARAARGARLVVVGAVRSDSPLAEAPMVRAFAAAARRLTLPALTPAEVGEMLRSVFGDAAYLDRLSARLHAVSQGVPGHCLWLVRHLIGTGDIRFVEGAFLLPAQLPESLPETLQASALSALEHLSEAARRIARLASVPDHGRMTRAMITTLSGDEPASVARTLALLRRERLLREANDGLSIAHPVLRERLWGELDDAQRARVHRGMAELLKHEEQGLELLRRALHLLRAGDFASGERLLLRAARGAHPQELRAAAPMYEAAYVLLREHGRSDCARVPALAMLAMAGYMVHHVYADRYGDDATAVFERVLRFQLARRWQPYLGGLLALVIALGVAGFAMRRSGLRLREVIAWLVPGVVALAGAAQTCMDLERARRHADALTPLTALGEGHAATLLRSYCLATTDGVAERQSEGLRRMQAVLALFERPGSIPGMQPQYLSSLLAGARYACGIIQALRLQEDTVETARRIQGLGPLAAIQADQLRAEHYGWRGDRQRALFYRRRVERQGIQLGAAWQVELYALVRDSRLALWLDDAALAKRAAHGLERLARQIPSLSTLESSARATYLVLRKRELDALPHVADTDDTPKQAGWSYRRALLARIYNALGQHQKAKEVCMRTLASISEEDLAYVAAHLNTLTELALADAGLGAFAEAEQRLEQLQHTFADRGPLVEGWICRVRARVALLKGEHEAAEAQLQRMERAYRTTDNPSLLALTAELRDALQRARRPSLDLDAPLGEHEANLLTRVSLVMTGEQQGLEKRALTALRLVRDLTGAERGFIVYSPVRGDVAALDYAPSPEVCEWAQARLIDALAEGERTASLEGDAPVAPDEVRVFDGLHHSVCVLWRLEDHVEQPVAALVLADGRGAPALPPAAALRLMGERLISGADNDQT